MTDKNSGGDVSRRSWDEAAFSRRAAQRTAAGDEETRRKVPAKDRVLLERRNHQELIDADALAGSTVVVADGASKAEAGGFYCEYCDVLLHDSSAYLNHVNGRAHHAVIGIALQVKQSTAEEVRDAFQAAFERRRAREELRLEPKTLAERVEQRKAEHVALRRLLLLEKKKRKQRDLDTVHDGNDGSQPAGRGNEAWHEMRKLGLPTSF
jgi:U4/U6.U5 tri-snRNP component SNU23